MDTLRISIKSTFIKKNFERLNINTKNNKNGNNQQKHGHGRNIIYLGN
nr:MAG TPA: hypothetical protein [Caudoviricetes sp.]